MAFTHRLRASHDAILVGIGTILSDNPRLNVRHSDGAHPTPVVLDTNLRFPADAQLFSCDGPSPIIATNESAPEERKKALEDRDATVIRLSCADNGICLESLLDALGERGFRSVMVEGGTEVITSFLNCRLVNHVILTIAPILVGGQHALQSTDVEPPDGSSDKSAFPRLDNVQYQWFGEDLVMEGTPVWPQ